MSSIFSILTTAAAGLRTQQGALNVTSHNIANASTDGYARQRAVITTNPALLTPHGVFGAGSGIADVQQIRDYYMDADFRRETADAAGHQSRADMLVRLETVFGEPSDVGLSATLDRFLSAWSDLATNPGNDSVRSVVRQRASELVTRMHELTANLDQIRQEVEDRLTDNVARANDLIGTIARLNEEIVTVEAGGPTAGDLRDERNAALDDLSRLTPITVHEQENGAVGVSTSGINLITGVDGVQLETASSGTTWGIGIVGRAGLLPDRGGATGGLLEVLNTDLPAAVASLDALASALVTDINALHQTGTNADGNTGIDFFDPAGTEAWSLALSADVDASARAIAAGTPDGAGQYRAGANDIALSIAAFRDAPLGALGTTPGDHVRGLVFSIGLAVRSSTEAVDVHGTLAEQADMRRMSLSGVSVDEELIQMIQFQTAYQAAARIVTAADEMLESLLRI